MLSFSYKCDHCGLECTKEYERGTAPRVQECPDCKGTLRRVIKVTNSADVSASDTNDNKSGKVRKNLKERQKKLNKMSPDERKRLETWSKNQTGGRW